MEKEVETREVGLRTLPRRQVLITLLGVALAMFLGSLDQTVVGTAMPRIITDVGGFSHYTWVTTAYIVTSAVALPITGKLTDMFGRKYFYIAGLGIFTLASLLCGLSNTMTQLIIFRGLQGIGAGVMMANAFTVIGDLFSPAERGKYQGYMSGVFGLSSIIGPSLGGFVTDVFSWHWVFFINVPIGVAIISLFLIFFPNLRPDTRRHQVDYGGVVALILVVVPLMLALSWGGTEYPWISAEIIGMFVSSVVMAVIFTIMERRSKEPIVPISLFKNQIVAISVLVIFFTAFGMFGSIIFVPLFFQGVLGASATASGSFLTPMMLSMVAGGIVSGQFLSRAGGHYRLQGAVGIGVMALGMWLLSQMTTNTSYAQTVINIILTGFGIGITMPLYTIAVQNAVPYNVLGAATSSTAFFRPLGGSVGLAIFGSIMNNRFAAEFINAIPASVKAVIPLEQLVVLTHNPRAMMSAGAEAQLKSMMEQFGPQGTELFDRVLLVLRQSLSSALSHVFFIALLILAVAFVANLFIKEIPLRKRHIPTVPLTVPKPKDA